MILSAEMKRLEIDLHVHHFVQHISHMDCPEIIPFPQQ
jgi:hypothetical protein